MIKIIFWRGAILVMSNKITKGNFKLALAEAEAFYQTACMAESEHFSLDCNSAFLFPFVVNLSFACELYMKSIMMFTSKENTFLKEYDLKELFENLNADIQENLRSNFEVKGKRLSNFLEKHKNHFVDFRYAFEEKEKSLCVFSTDLGDFVNCLRSYRLMLRKDD